jgi:hypothetical protein
MIDQNLEVARRYALARPGMTLLDCEPVGLPYYWLTLDSLILERKDKPVLEEFVLEAVHAGLNTVEDVSSFLGVDRIMIETAAAALYQADSLDYLAIPGRSGRRLSLTPVGRELRESLKMVTPKRTDIYIAFDRLLWRPTDVRKPDLLRPKDAKAAKLRLINPRQAKKPGTDQLRIEDVEKVIRRVVTRDRLEADLLRIIRVTRAEARYLLGDLLVFQPDDGQDLQMMMAIDGRLAPTHEDVLNQLGGLRFIGISPTAAKAEADDASQLPPELIAERVPLAEVRRAQARIANATRHMEQVTARRTEFEDATEVSSPEEAKAELKAAQQQLDSIEVREVETYEMRSLLERAMRESRQRLLIVSPWIRAEVVDSDFLDGLSRLLRTGIEVHIGFGISSEMPRDERDRKAIESLRKLADGHKNMTIGQLGNTHAKILVADDTIVTGSFNWLSFKADRKRTYRQELGTLVRKTSYVEPLYLERRREIEAAAGRDR